VNGGHGAPDSVLSDLTGAGATHAESITAAREAGFGAVTFREAGARVGARLVNTLCTDPDEERALGRLAELCRLAASYELSIGQEFSSYNAVDSLEKGHRMVERLRDPAAVVVVDALRLRTGGTPSDVAAFVRMRPGLYPVVQLCDAPRALAEPTAETLAYEARNERLLPGEGEFALEELVHAMPSATQYAEVPSSVLARRSFVDRARAAADALAGLRSRVAQDPFPHRSISREVDR